MFSSSGILMSVQVYISTVSWFLLFQNFVPVYPCQPPDYPEGGFYKPVNATYPPMEDVVYSCGNGLTLFGKSKRTCQRDGKWSGFTPFCDIPTKLKQPCATTDPNRNVATVVDNSTNTCFTTEKQTGQSLKVYLDSPAPVHSVRLRLQKGHANLHIKLVTEKGKNRTTVVCSSCSKYIEDNKWETFMCSDNNFLANYLDIQETSGVPTALRICEVEAYVKGDYWCRDPPNYSIVNGRFEVSRRKASLKCVDGYRDRHNSRLTCEKNMWNTPILQCEEILCPQAVGNETKPRGEWVLLDFEAMKLSVGIQRQLKCEPGFHYIGKPNIVTCTKAGVWSSTTATCIANPPEKASSLKIAVISIGGVVAIVIVFLLALTVYLLYKKRSSEVVVLYKPEEGYEPRYVSPSYATPSYASPSYASPSLCTSTSEAEYSVVYNEELQPPMTPSRPPHLKPIIGGGYSKPLDEQQPVDIAFGTLKSSVLYGGMD